MTAERWTGVAFCALALVLCLAHRLDRAAKAGRELARMNRVRLEGL